MYNIVFDELEELRYGRREAINSLKTNLRFAGNDIRVVAFTSTNQNEGKSTVCFDLAKAYADNGEKVLLIDADMRKTVMMQRYSIEGSRDAGGLTHYLSGQRALNDVICTTNIENLFLIMAGPLSPNPTELLHGGNFEVLLRKLRPAFDIIIVDTPPIGAVIDAAIIAPKCDGVIIVIEANETSSRALISVKKQLEMTKSKILGCVLNKVTSGSSQYRYRNKYYGEYGTRESRRQDR